MDFKYVAISVLWNVKKYLILELKITCSVWKYNK